VETLGDEFDYWRMVRVAIGELERQLVGQSFKHLKKIIVEADSLVGNFNILTVPLGP
jgi:hypothetical protein